MAAIMGGPMRVDCETHDVAVIEATQLKRRVTDLEAEATFLLARLSEVDFSMDPEDMGREWDGHVEPSIARMRTLLGVT